MKLLILCFCLLLNGRSFAQTQHLLDPTDTNLIWKNLRPLANDSMLGRRPGTKGENIAVNYLINAFREAGLTPAYQTSFLQPVHLAHATTTGIISINNRTLPDSLLVIKCLEAGNIRFEEAELVFVGFGVTAPEFGWDDYKGKNINGKVAVILDKESSLLMKKNFGGFIAETYQSQFNVKDQNAKFHGAIGSIILTDIARFSPQIKSWQQKDYTLLEQGLGDYQTKFLIRTSKKGSVQFTEQIRTTLDSLKKLATDSNFTPFPLAAKGDFNIETTTTLFDSYNIVGYIEGSDAILKNECIVYSTHWDGYGITFPQKGDSICNAAKDNAGGIAEMLLIATKMKKLPVAPGRSIVFVASTAEESGKLGAEAYVRSPLFPLKKTVLAIGMDIFAPWGRATMLHNESYAYTSMDCILRYVAAKWGLPYGGPTGVSQFAASDQYMFARRGIPAIFAGTSCGSFNLSDAVVDSIENVMRAHSPFDEISPLWDLRSAATEASILLETGILAANKKDPPHWLIKTF